MRGVSVIICCYNSGERLPNTLAHLAKQELKDLPWEIIIVNNNSTDRTEQIAEQEWQKFNLKTPFKIVKEVTPGLSFARERGLREVRYKYVIFCDDDNWLMRDYIFKAFEIMEQNPTIGVLGGRSEVASNILLPFWFSTFQSYYAVGVQAIDSGDISNKGYVWGAGMIINRYVIDDLKAAGFVHLLSGRNGQLLTSGEDAEICKWFLIAGYQIWYHEDLLFRHFIPENRLTRSYFNSLSEGFVLASTILTKYDFFINHILKKERSRINNMFRFFYQAYRFIFWPDKFSKIYLAFTCPLKISRFLDIDCYKIRVSVKNMSNQSFRNS